MATFSHCAGLAMAAGLSPSPMPPNPKTATFTTPSTLSPDRLTSLPTETMLQIVSRLNNSPIQALRSVNRAAETKTYSHFASTCLQTLNITTSKVGFRQRRNLQVESMPEQTKRVVLTTRTTNGFRNTSTVKTPLAPDVKAVFAVLPNITSIDLEDDTKLCSSTHVICRVLTASPCKNLTGLELEGYKMPGNMLTQLLGQHDKTLKSLTFRNLTFTDGTTVKSILPLFRLHLNLETLEMDTLHESVGSKEAWAVIPLYIINMQSPPTKSLTREQACPCCSTTQSYVVTKHSATMTGHFGVKWGLTCIINRRFPVPEQLA